MAVTGAAEERLAHIDSQKQACKNLRYQPAIWINVDFGVAQFKGV